MSAVLIPEGSLFDELVQSGNASASAFSALAQLLDELEWKGSLNELMAHLPLEYDALDDSDIPYLLAEFEENMSDFDNLEIQLETFGEILLFRKE